METIRIIRNIFKKKGYDTEIVRSNSTESIYLYVGKYHKWGAGKMLRTYFVVRFSNHGRIRRRGEKPHINIKLNISPCIAAYLVINDYNLLRQWNIVKSA